MTSFLKNLTLGRALTWVGILVIAFWVIRGFLPRTTQVTVGAPADGDVTGEGGDSQEYRIVTLLPKDAIPAIDDPQFLKAQEASAEYDTDELVLGVFINGEARAYSTSFLSSHEIVNDTVGGRKIAVTW